MENGHPAFSVGASPWSILPPGNGFCAPCMAGLPFAKAMVSLIKRRRRLAIGFRGLPRTRRRPSANGAGSMGMRRAPLRRAGASVSPPRDAGRIMRLRWGGGARRAGGGAPWFDDRRSMNHRRSSKAPGRPSFEECTTSAGGSNRRGHDPVDLVSAVSEPCELGDGGMSSGGPAACGDEPPRVIEG